MRHAPALLACLALFAGSCAAEDLAIVVAKSVPIDNLSSEELGKIFRCEQTEAPDHTKLQIFTREKGCPERETMLRVVYQMPEAAYNRFFMHLVFTGQLTAAPRVVASGAALKSLTAGNPGVVSYLRQSQVDDTVKVVKIDGMAPGDPKYPLKLAP